MSISFYALRSAQECEPIDFHDDGARPNFHTGGAMAVLRTLGLVSSDADLWSAHPVPIVEFRRACMRGRSEARAERSEVPTVNEQRVWTLGIDIDAILRRVDQLAEWAACMSAKGATLIYWG